MEARDRLANLCFFAASALTWLAVGLLLVTRDPLVDPAAGTIGAALIGLALGLTCIPLFWLAVFSRHGQIAYRGDWIRAVRRGAWVAGLAVLFVALRLQGIFQPQILIFVLAIVVVAETTLSVDR